MSSISWHSYRHDPSQGVPDPTEPGGPEALRSKHAIRELEDRVDRLSMICCAMWTIIQAHADVSDDDLIRLVQELDLSDGSLDGKVRLEQVAPCPACQRPVATRHLRCLYCGAERRAANPFERVL